LPTQGQFKREEVEKGGVYLPQDPFKPDNAPSSGTKSVTNDAAVQRLSAKIQQLEAQGEEIKNAERNLRNEHATLQRQYDILLAKVSAIKRLQDSVALLNQRMESLVNQSYVADDISVSNETATEMVELERENEQLKLQNASLVAEADSLSAIVQKHKEQLARLASDSKAAAEQIARLRDENKKSIDSLNEEIRAARGTADTAKAELASQEKETEALQSTVGSPSSGHVSATDSVKSLMRRLSAAERQAFEASAMKDALGRTQAELLTQGQELRKTHADLSARSTELAEERMATSNLQKSLAEAQWKLGEDANVKTAMQQEMDRYQQQNRSLQADLNAEDALAEKLTAENKTLKDSVAKVLLQKSVLERDLEARERSLLQQIQTGDSLHSQLTTAMLHEKDLRRSVSTLQGRVDSLARIRVPESQQAGFLKEQRSILDQREKDLSARELAVKDKEKLLSQREYALLKRESEAADQEARFRNLEDRERRIQLLEQQLNAREGISPADLNSVVQVKEGYIVESGERVPVFVVESSMGYKTVQRQIVGYMLSRDELFDDRFPELLYRAASLAELDSEAVEMKVRIESNGSGSRLQISFLLAGGEYLGGIQHHAGDAAAKQLIIKMLRYKF
jgi:chromosome segregation ATPase